MYSYEIRCGIIKNIYWVFASGSDSERPNFWNVLNDRSGGAFFVIHKQVPFKQI